VFTTHGLNLIASKSTLPVSQTVHPYNLRHALERFERDYLHNILVLANWDITRAAEMLGISSRTLTSKMKRYDLVC
jgi:DNA-binding NtrC family response regulator